MANNDGKISTPDHLKAMRGKDDLMAHLTEDHGQTKVPVGKASQAKLHDELHKAEAAPKPEPTPAPAAEAAPEATPAEEPVAGPMTELEALKAQLAEAQAKLEAAAAAPVKTATYGAPEAKNDLFKGAVVALDEYVAGLKDDDPILKVVDRADAARMISQAIHHFATGRSSDGKRIWPATTLPKPQRSDWK